MRETRFVDKKTRLRQVEEEIEQNLENGNLEKAETLSKELVLLAESNATHVLVEEQETPELSSMLSRQLRSLSFLPFLMRKARLALVLGVMLLSTLFAVQAFNTIPLADKEKESIPTYSQHLENVTGRGFEIASHSEDEHWHLIHSYLNAYGQKIFASKIAQDGFIKSACDKSANMTANQINIPASLQEAPNARVGRQLDDFVIKRRG